MYRPSTAAWGNVAGLLLALFGASACSLVPKSLGGASESEQQMVSVQDNQHLTQGDAALADDNYNSAANHYKKALRAAQPTSNDDYYLKGSS